MRTVLVAVFVLLPFSVSATVPPARGVVMPDHLRVQAAKIRADYGQGYWSDHMQQRRIMRERAEASGMAARLLTTDTVYAPVLLGHYSDVSSRITPTAFQQHLFDGPNPTGTVTEFYTQCSFGQMHFTGSAEGWFGLPRDMNYYVHDGGSRNAGLVYGGRDFTIDIIPVADATVDFARFVKYYDAQGRGHVPQLGIVHTGADAAAGADNIWSHRWNIRGRLLERKGAGSDPYFDVNRVTPEGWYITNDTTATGKPVLIDGDYAIEPELSGSSNYGNTIVDIGVFAHEFGHIFGLPDLYDTDGSSEGLGQWCVMASGSWGGDGAHPAVPSQFSAWCKEKLGWITPTMITTYHKGQTISDAETHPECYKLWKLGVAGVQYFLVENRQKTGFDYYLPNSGLLIFHVDNSQLGNTDENHYLVDVEQADGNRDLNKGNNRGDAGDPFPGSTNKHFFDSQSVPNSHDYRDSSSYVGVRNISGSAATMTADLDVGTQPRIVLNSVALFEGPGGNGNGRVEPGEVGTLALQVANVNPGAGAGVQMHAALEVTGAHLDTTFTFSVGGLSATILSLPGALRVDPSFVPQEVSLDFTVVASPDTTSFSSTTVLGYPSILIVDRDSTAENIVRFFRAAVGGAGYHFESMRIADAGIAAAAMDKRSIVVWFSGRRKTQTVQDSARQALLAHLNAGRNLFITGQNIAEDLRLADSTFLIQALHARWSKNITIGRVLNGIPEDYFGRNFSKLIIAGADAAANQTSPDELSPDSTAHPIFRYNSTTGSSYAGLWREDQATHAKLAFFGFGFEAISDSSSTASRQQVMGALLDWFSGITGVPAIRSDGRIPTLYTLEQNYPNPFNPTTGIRYQVPAVSHVRLVVYDILGREVTTLVNEREPGGVYTVTWDAHGCASGVYFCRFEAAPADGGRAFVATRKMVLLR